MTDQLIKGMTVGLLESVVELDLQRSEMPIPSCLPRCTYILGN